MNNLFDQMDTSIIKVIGVGGGGSNAVAYMYKQGIVGVDFAVCNTDRQALEDNPVQHKVHLGPSLTEGMGAGSIPEVGKQSCIESIDDVRKFLEHNTKMLFVTAGLGGGTGTGAAPIIAKAAKELGILTVAIVTLPFRFEGLRRQNQALEGLETLKKNVDSILVISNEKLKCMYSNLAISEAFAKADDILSTAAKGIAEIITVAGQINVDFKDVNTVMKNSGVSIMGYAEAEGEDRARKAVQDALNSPLLEDNDIRGAQHILLNITSGSKEVTMEEVTEITEYIQEEAGYGTDMIWGNCFDDSLGSKLSVTIIATGFSNSNNDVAEVKITKKIPLDGDVHAEKTPSVFDITSEDPVPGQVIEFDAPTVTPPSTSEPFIRSAQPEMPIEEKTAPIVERRRVVQRTKPKSAGITRPLDNPKDINELEDIPAYKRKQVSLDDADDIATPTNEHSKLSINIDDMDGPIIERNNSFFHNNVD